MTPDARICILGPIPSEKDFGGVAVFDAALGKAFTQLGYDVVWCTKQNFHKGEFVNNIYTISLFNIRKVISAAKPIIIIASLDYAKYFFLLKHRCIKIHYLHGFFNVAHYGLLKYNLCWLYQKIISKKCDKVYSNSHYTKTITEDIMGLHVDKAIPIGISDIIIHKALESCSIKSIRKHSIIFVGRLAKSKKIGNIIEAFRTLVEKFPDCTLEIIGDGPEKNNLQMLSENIPNITFLGRMDHDNIFKHEFDSEVFISLCPSESYGMAFIEALFAGCKIVEPETGGQVETLEEYTDRVVKVNPYDTVSISNGIIKAFSLKPDKLNIFEMAEHFSYTSTAKAILHDNCID